MRGAIVSLDDDNDDDDDHFDTIPALNIYTDSQTD